MATKKNSSTLKIVCATSVCVFSLAAVFGEALAWFTSVRTMLNDANEMKADYDDIHAKFFLYKYDTSTMRATDVDNDGNPWNIKNFQLNTFDTIFTSRNKYTSALVRMEISGEDLKENGTLTLDMSRDLSIDETWTERGELNTVISSVISFKCFTNASVYETLIDDSLTYPVDEMYTLAYNTASTETSQYFPKLDIDLDENEEEIRTYSKLDALQFTVDYTSSDWVNIDGVDSINIYLLIEYDTTLVKWYVNNDKEFTAEKLSDNETAFDNDLKSFVVTHDW